MAARTDEFASERDLVAALIANEPAAWEVFVSRYEPFVLGVARQTLRRSGADEHLAPDVVSEVFAELLQNERAALTRFREPWSFKGWLSVVASRRARRLLRGVRRIPDPLEEPTQVAADGRSPASELGRIEDRERVRDQLEELKPRDRLALQLFYEGGRSYKEVADLLDLPVGRVGTLLARARARLGSLLERA
ncbi:MAG: RNA polymerase sigma factor [Planctomycetota bacterium]